MDFGVQVSVYRVTWDAIRRTVEALEAGRWGSAWFADHFVPPPGPREDEPLTAFEGLSAMAAVAGITDRLRLGHLVLGNTYRNPALVAKMAGTIDHVSNGRFTLGIGASWFKREHEAYGWDFPSMKERQDRLEESCALLRALFRAEEPVDFDGAYYRLDAASLSPGSFGDPIPILVGGTGEKRTLRTLAMYGDVFNLDGWAGGGVSRDYYRHKIGVLERHCEDVGRDPAEIRRTLLMPVMMTTDQARIDALVGRVGEGAVAGPPDYVVERIGELVEEGVDEIMFGALPTGNLELLQRFEEEVLSAFD